MQKNTKEWIQYGSAIGMLLSAVGLSYLCFFMFNDIKDNILWYAAQTLIYAGSIFGVAIAIDSKFESLKDKFFNHNKNEKED